MLEPRTHRRAQLVSFLLLLAPATALASGFKGAEAIQPGTLKRNITTLAADAMQGRGSGAKGGKLAAEWLAKECKQLGLTPGGDKGTYFHNFTAAKHTMRNVVAVIPGSQPGEAVVIGAHYDHLGLGHQMGSLAFGRGRGKIHNGADDNASGTAAILEIARAFKSSGVQPKRSIVFVWFDGEERGLLGSRAYVENPPVKSKVVLMINLDMVGRLRTKLTLYGAPSGDLLPGWIQKANKAVGLELDVKQTITRNSDHYNFYSQGIPVLMPFTGLHGDYHRPSDDSDKVNAAGAAKVAALCYGVAVQAADANKNAKFKKLRDGTLESAMEQLRAMLGNRGGDLGKLFGGDGKGFDLSKLGDRLRELFGRGRGRTRTGFNRPQLGVRLKRDGVTVRSVTPRSVAARAGIKADDRIVSINGVGVENFANLRSMVMRSKGKVPVVVRRGEETLSLTADFGGKAAPRKPQPKKTPKKKKSPKKDEPRWF